MSLAEPYEIEVNESSSLVYTATLKDEDDDPILAADISALTLTLIETDSGDVVNSRDGQNVLNTNNCTIHATSGLFTWNIQVEDTEILGAGVDEFETHLATITVGWGTGRQMHREILIKVKNLRSVT